MMMVKRMVATAMMGKRITTTITLSFSSLLVMLTMMHTMTMVMEKAVTTTRILAVVMTTMADEATTTMTSTQWQCWQIIALVFLVDGGNNALTVVETMMAAARVRTGCDFSIVIVNDYVVDNNEEKKGRKKVTWD